tara:strand:+ start:1616 stop:2035 length:420 start_codon:yes stop_codon:yes gene_type:complete
MEGVNMSINLELYKYINKHAQDKYKWGEEDCMLFPAGWVDTYYDEDTCRNIKHKYWDRRTALVFYKNYLSTDTVLRSVNFVEQEDISSVEDGDIIQTGTLEWPLLWVVFDNAGYCMSEQGLIFVTWEALQSQAIKVWRR